MLGFSPLASTPLGDDGEQLDSNLIRTQPITLGQAVVGTVTLEEVAVVVALSGNNVVSGNPVVGQTSVTTNSELSLNAVTTVPAVVGQIVVSEENNIILALYSSSPSYFCSICYFRTCYGRRS